MKIVKLLKQKRVILLNFLRSCKENIGFFRRKFIEPKIPVNENGKVYVNLGCGVNTSKEFINVDARGFPHTHYIHDVQDLSMFKNESVDLLYASHLLEHVPRSEVRKTLSEWYRVLKDGGILRFGVPNFDNLIEIYQVSGKDVDSIVNQLMGGDGVYDDHHTIWNIAYAKKNLERVGFSEVREWSPNEVEHHNFTDKTMRKFMFNGKEINISLNVEAIK
jgi:SAM-dependent methyltransferase